MDIIHVEGAGAPMQARARRTACRAGCTDRRAHPHGVWHGAGSVDAPRDVDIIDTELILSDAQTLENTLNRLQYVSEKTFHPLITPSCPPHSSVSYGRSTSGPCVVRCGRRKGKAGVAPEDASRRNVLARCLDALGKEQPVRSIVWEPADEAVARAVIKETGLLTAKPVVYVANIDERQMTQLMLDNVIVCTPGPFPVE